MKEEQKIVLYDDAAVAYFDGPEITLGTLLDLVERASIPRETRLIGLADEEGNQEGRIYRVVYDEEDGVLEFTPAI